jgi:two-component system, OmpR family, alkaline phosphatase synthesis response regulator PhoP
MANKLIYILEDDENINEILKFNLEKSGFEVRSFFNGNNFFKGFVSRKPDLVVLDLMLPDIDGYEVCRRIKKESDAAILILSAKGEELDKVIGLELGADDYMVKPFGIRELLARIKNILNKAELITRSANSKFLKSSYDFDNKTLTIDEESHSIYLEDIPVTLNPKEFRTLVLLLKNIDNLTTRNDLIRDVWGDDYFGDTRTLDVHIRRIREKMSYRDFGKNHIKTVHGLGYKLISG